MHIEMFHKNKYMDKKQRLNHPILFYQINLVFHRKHHQLLETNHEPTDDEPEDDTVEEPDYDDYTAEGEDDGVTDYNDASDEESTDYTADDSAEDNNSGNE